MSLNQKINRLPIKAKTLSAILIILVSVSIFMVLKFSKPEVEKTIKTEQSYPVKAVTVAKQSLHPELTLYGKIESPYSSTISSVIVADVERLLSLEGQAVQKGQTLIQLDPKNIGLLVKQRAADVASIKSKLNNSKKELKRQESLFKRKIVSSSKVEGYRQTVVSLTADLSRSQAQFNQIKSDQSRSKVVAPFLGRITKMFVSPGDRVNIGSKLLSIYDTSRLEVRAQLPNHSLERLRDLWSKNQKITALIDGKTLATLSRITGDVKSNSAGIDAFFSINQKDNGLSLGKAVKLTVKLPLQENVMLIPYGVIYQQNKVYLIKDSRLILTQIDQLGQFTQNNKTYALVDTQNFSNTDIILFTQLPNAITGLKVDVVDLDDKEIR